MTQPERKELIQILNEAINNADHTFFEAIAEMIRKHYEHKEKER